METARAILWVDANVISILDNLSEDFFPLKYLLLNISLVISALVSGMVYTLLRRLCLLSETT